MRACIFDTETTGVDYEKGHRMIELAMILMNMDYWSSEECIHELYQPNRPIDPKAQAVHGISLTDLIDKPEFSEAMAIQVNNMMHSADILVAHNLDFDMPFLYGEVMAKLPDTETLADPLTFCTMENGRWAGQEGKHPSLHELCRACEVEYDPTLAHDAIYDTTILASCFQHACGEQWWHRWSEDPSGVPFPK